MTWASRAEEILVPLCERYDVTIQGYDGCVICTHTPTGKRWTMTRPSYRCVNGEVDEAHREEVDRQENTAPLRSQFLYQYVKANAGLP